MARFLEDAVLITEKVTFAFSVFNFSLKTEADSLLFVPFKDFVINYALLLLSHATHRSKIAKKNVYNPSNVNLKKSCAQVCI